MKKLHILLICVLMVAVSDLQAQERFGKGKITQLGLVVNNIEKATEKWATILGYSEKPQIIITDEYEKAHTQFEGKPSEAKAKLAFFRLDNITIELIEPVGKNSTWYQHLKEHGEGFHHIAFNVDGMEKSISFLEAKGGKLQQRGDFTGGSYSYVNMSEVGIIIELLTSTGN